MQDTEAPEPAPAAVPAALIIAAAPIAPAPATSAAPISAAPATPAAPIAPAPATPAAPIAAASAATVAPATPIAAAPAVPIAGVTTDQQQESSVNEQQLTQEVIGICPDYCHRYLHQYRQYLDLNYFVKVSLIIIVIIIQ